MPSSQFVKSSVVTISNGASISADSKYTRVFNMTHLIPYEVYMSEPPKSSEDGTTTYNWALKQRRGHSALYAGIHSLDKDWDSYYVGFVGQISDAEDKPIEQSCYTEELKKSVECFLLEKKVVPVFLEDELHHGHYEGFCKTVLWPLFHYILWDTATDGRQENHNWLQYCAVNQAFTDKIKEIYSPDSLIWIHDYHLLMVPRMLRNALPDAAIGLFIHAPFPSSEIFRCLPQRKEVLDGMLGANQIGFQTYSYARHFISNCTRILGYESTPSGVDARGSLVSVGPFPIGIDAERVEVQRKGPDVATKMAALKEMHAGKRIIVGRDKLDLVKGVIQKLHAFEKFLSEYPEWQNKVVLIQVTSPSFTESPKLERRVAELIAQINGTYGSLEYTPVHHLHSQIEQDEYFALLSIADIGLITSVRDGMNTTSLEYIMCQQENYGPLILSEFTGMAGSLGAAIMVNPWDYSGVAKAINDALIMSNEEKQNKHLQLYRHVTVHTAQFWAKSFIKELVQCLTSSNQTNTTPSLDAQCLLTKYKQSKNRLLLFDYDGTLTPIVKTPSQAIPPPEMLEALQKLAEDPKNTVWIVSGRDQDVLEEWLGSIKKLGFSAEHGCFLKYPESDKWVNLTEDIDMSWKTDVDEIFTYFTERTQGSSIERKRSSITWHYRQADPEYGAFQAKECQNHLEGAILPKLPVEILLGKKNLEVRPTLINKGEIVKRLLTGMQEVDFVFCAGDDRTDEDMFRVLKRTPDFNDLECFTVTIGPPTKKTLASWHVSSPEELIQTMKKLATS
ncbi:glycosyltransferase family 20-domain-containing protein [Gigaspora margarita]|uniref:Glycosyltransferase family 20-domain-containing protein n=1 Tax=Gigaspora margarita TaxID=4874 RepID=A0A8H4A4M6_GIGMA|nr:glycosyltransferase family 20-domain-containing protein [Gigaspora margarita]